MEITVTGSRAQAQAEMAAVVAAERNAWLRAYGERFGMAVLHKTRPPGAPHMVTSAQAKAMRRAVIAAYIRGMSLDSGRRIVQ